MQHRDSFVGIHTYANSIVRLAAVSRLFCFLRMGLLVLIEGALVE